MKTYLIMYKYARQGVVEVQAESFDQAKDLAIELSVNNASKEFYVDDSFEIDDDYSHEVIDNPTEN
jgi:hypothetical protein